MVDDAGSFPKNRFILPSKTFCDKADEERSAGHLKRQPPFTRDEAEASRNSAFVSTTILCVRTYGVEYDCTMRAEDCERDWELEIYVFQSCFKGLEVGLPNSLGKHLISINPPKVFFRPLLCFLSRKSFSLLQLR